MLKFLTGLIEKFSRCETETAGVTATTTRARRRTSTRIVELNGKRDREENMS